MKHAIDEQARATVQELAALLQTQLDPSLLAEGTEEVFRFFNRVGAGAEYPRGEDGGRLRWQDKVIEQEIPVGSSVLDLGCGGGELLARLRDMKQVRGQGVELDADAVLQCVERGVPVFQANLDEGLSGFPDDAFDYVVLEETIQTLHRPAEVLHAMLRVGRRGIVTFPNFGYWQVRLDLAMRGRMPRTPWLPYHWHDTPNIHLCTIHDFLLWAERAGVRVVDGYVLNKGEVRKFRITDNLHAEEALFLIETDPDGGGVEPSDAMEQEFFDDPI